MNIPKSKLKNLQLLEELNMLSKEKKKNKKLRENMKKLVGYLNPHNFKIL